ncbi:MAG: LicD family protein [Fibrobacter sp.]|nr:LicD family protein [Fibrobacter sp.]MBQ5464465.1 LicD family protein [Fibrobacter sp.]MBR5692731.1 LicD family protein [Fibrobacter sp.]
MGIAHKIYTFLGGKEGSFLQKKWSYFCKKRDYRKRQKVLHQNGLELLQKFKEACQECNVDYWVEFGTLLGAVRNKSFIPHDIDIDVAMMKDSYSAELEQRLTSKGFVKDHHFDRLIVQSGERTTSEHTFHYKGLAIDIFLVFHEKNTYKLYEYIVQKGCVISETISYTIDNVLPLSTVKIDNLELNAPCNPQNSLTLYYGENFMIPDPNWNSADWENDNVVHHPTSEITGVLIRAPKTDA